MSRLTGECLSNPAPQRMMAIGNATAALHPPTCGRNGPGVATIAPLPPTLETVFARFRRCVSRDDPTMTLHEPEAITLQEDDGSVIELFVVDAGAHGDTHKPTMLIVHGHQFPERPGGQGRVTSALIKRFVAKRGIVAAVSQPGYGRSSGPPDCCGPNTQRALRAAFAYLIGRGAAPARTVVWGISRGAVAASCAFVDGTPEPGVLILQAGTYDMAGWVNWVHDGAKGGNLELAKAILANQLRETGRDLKSLRVRSGTVQATRGSCDVLLVHGACDPQAPPEDRVRMVDALTSAGRRVETVIVPRAAHRLSPNIALDALEQHWPHLAV